ncbi:hypothetical protein DYB32_003779 [Aphanomyces invadans]|uniref:VPS9 domain-containing protein n=1 Tax=Aphanomyces invadans TaxID=157072 RepID=A0A418AZM4_9STRA|nr:hypothetical protein DYB32_003779 [Aphanomyces invadans]
MAEAQPEMSEARLTRLMRQKDVVQRDGMKKVIQPKLDEMDRVSTDSSDDNQDEVEEADGVDDGEGVTMEDKYMSELQFLRNQVQDLQGALKARDMELFQLRERYDLLLVAVEQQDETIAAIYATTNTASSDAHLQQYSALRESSMLSSAPSPPCVKRTAKEMLLGHLDSMGFDADSVGLVLEAFHDTTVPPASPSTRSSAVGSGATDLAALNSALDQLLNTDATSGSQVQQSSSSATTIMPAYANKSGFLRPAVRRHSSKRLSVSDFGLFNHESAEDILQPTEERRQSDPLFAGMDEYADTSNQPLVQAKIKRDEELEELSYSVFLERLSLPGSKDIVEAIRRFVGSVLGPRGDGWYAPPLPSCFRGLLGFCMVSPPTSAHFVDYIFYGHESFQQRCEEFFRSIDETLATHPAWRHAPERILRHARDGIEKYVMDKLADVPLHKLPESAAWKAEDAALWRRMQVLSQFITPDMLDIKPSMRNEVVWSIAQDELRHINEYRSPGDKINCIVRCCSIIFSVLNLARGSDVMSRPGADDFLPVFIYLVLHSQVPSLVSNAEYIAAYRNPADLMSK